MCFSTIVRQGKIISVNEITMSPSTNFDNKKPPRVLGFSKVLPPRPQPHIHSITLRKLQEESRGQLQYKEQIWSNPFWCLGVGHSDRHCERWSFSSEYRVQRSMSGFHLASQPLPNPCFDIYAVYICRDHNIWYIFCIYNIWKSIETSHYRATVQLSQT